MTELPDGPDPLIPLEAPMARAVLPLSYASEPAEPVVFPQSALTRSAAKIDLAIMLIFMIGFMVVSLGFGLGELLEKHWPKGGHFAWAFANGLVCLAVVSFLLKLRGQSAAAIGLGNHAQTSVKKIVITAIIAVPCCMVAGAISNLLFTVFSRQDVAAIAHQRGEFFNLVAEIPLGWVLPLSIFVGIYEEIVFRGLILTRLRILSGSNTAPIIISSLIFGGMHFTQGWIGMCQTAMVGMVLAYIAVRVKSLWPCILAHALMDSGNILLLVLFNPWIQNAMKTLTSQAS